jgi:ABC-type phosphate transport system substrate-binding protein
MKNLLTILIFYFISCVTIASAQVYVVVNNSVELDSLSTSKLLEIFTLNDITWDDGENITVVEQKGNDFSKEKFYSYIELDQNLIKKIRLKKLFTGKARPPKSVSNGGEIIEMISKTPGSVGYINKEEMVESKNVKIVAIIET